jgi:hypothetical protein
MCSLLACVVVAQRPSRAAEAHGDLMMLTVSKELYDYWRELKGERSAPERNDVEPGAIRAILADTFILDFDRSRGFPFRISGSRADALFLRELRSSPFLQLWRKGDRETMGTILQRSADHARPYLVRAEAKPPGLTALAVQVMLLPLCHQGSAHARILGSIATESSPHWLGLIGAGEVALKSTHPLDTQGFPAVADKSAPDAEPVAPFATRPPLPVCASGRLSIGTS